MLKKICYSHSDKKLVIQLQGSEGCGYQREILALSIIGLSSIPQDIFEFEETPDTRFTHLLENNTFCSIVKVIKHVPQMWTKPAQACRFGAYNSGFPGTQLILNLAI